MAHKVYTGIDAATDLAKDSIAFEADEDDHFWSAQDAQDLRLTRLDYQMLKSTRGATHAFIDLNGAWHENGQMGWFGMNSAENRETYDGMNGEWWTFIKELPEDVELALVDAHI